MAEHFNQAWLLLGVGMVTVFAVLMLVVLIGNATIVFVNRFVPVAGGTSDGESLIAGQPGRSKIAAIVGAVQEVTGGRGHVVKIERKK